MRAADPARLNFTPELLIDPSAAGVSVAAYPDVWRQGSLELSLSYVFEPGSDLDGVTVDIPLPVLNQVD